MTAILVTGSKGQLGNEIKSLSGAYSGYEFVFTDSGELDITSRDAVTGLIKDVNPGWIINCASYTAVDKAEDNPHEAFAVNADGPANIVSAIYGTECRFLHISTDYIFDGKSNIPYTEADLPNPLSIYGKSKFEGEINALHHHRTMIVRTSWLYSSFGNNFIKTMLRLLREGRQPKVVFDQTGSPTYAYGLASALLTVISGVIRNRFPYVPGIYNYSDEGVCSWFDLAAEVALEAGFDDSVVPCLTEEYPSRAARPAYSVLNNKKIKDTYGINTVHWRKNLKKCLEKLI